MSVTFNRKPLSVGTPNSSDTKQYYFNHYNWKGLSQNKNFLSVDQETFSDAENVYIDEVGLLSSRPGLEFKYRFENKHINDIKVFDEYILFNYISDGKNYIDVIHENKIIKTFEVSNSEIKSFKHGDFIYIFTNDKILSYDTYLNEWKDAEMYNSITRVYTGGNFEIFQDENLFSSIDRYQYILNPSIKSDKYVSDTLNSNIYDKYISYRHFINEDKILHTIYADRENKFLNLIHQPLVYDASNFIIVNYYGVEVPTAFIYNDMLYKYENGSVYRASVSDMVFENIYVETRSTDINKFVKFKLQQSGRIMILYSDTSVYFDLDGSNVSYKGITGCTLDISEIYYNGKYVDIWTGVTYEFNSADETYSYVCKSVFKQISDDKDISVIYTTGIENVLENVPLIFSGHCEMSLSEKYQGIALSFVYDRRNYYGSYYFPTSADISLSLVNTYKCAIEKSSQYGFDYEFYNRGYNFTQNNKTLPVFVISHNVFNHEITIGIPEDVSDEDLFDYHYGKFQANVLNYPDLNYLRLYNKEHSVYYNGDVYYLKDYNLYSIVNDEEVLVSNKFNKFTLNSNSKYWFYLSEKENTVLSNYRVIPTELNVNINKTNYYNGVDVLMINDDIYLSKGSDLYIGNIVVDDWDDKTKLWFKKSSKHEMNNIINGIHSISDKEVAIFTSEDTWYNTTSDGLHYYIQSKIVPKLKNKSQIITLQDSTTTLMPSENGVIALSYQNFVNTTEQSTVNLTQDLTEIYDNFLLDIRIINWKNYTIFYESGTSKFLIYDNRNKSWWKWKFEFLNLIRLFVYDNNLYVLTENKILMFNFNKDYNDELSENETVKVDWYIESQKLHLNANNYYKHIVNLTLSSVDSGEEPISMNLDIKNYRKYVDNGKPENFDYDIDVIRTFVKRLNYAKVCEFQYRLSSDSSNAIDVPLKLSNITIKYKIGGQVR